MTATRRLALVLLLSVLLGCSGHAAGRHLDDAGAPEAVRARFWAPVEIDGNWAEFHPSIAELVRAADLTVLGEVDAVERGTVLQGDAEEDVTFHVVLKIRVAEILRGASDTERVELPLIVPEVSSEAELNSAVKQMRAGLPVGPVVLMLRRRRDNGAWRPVNGYAIWAETSRVDIDTPLEPYPPQEGIFGPELQSFDTFAQFVEKVRSYARAPD